MTTAAHLIATAARYVGTKERPLGSNRQPFAKIAGHADGQPWCATFTAATAKLAGLVLPPGATSAYCPTAEAAYRKAGRLGTHPKVGAQFFIYFTTMDRVAHTGWVTAVHADGTVSTIEGNTNGNGSREGDRVARKRRPIGRAPGRTGIRSYGYPAYTSPKIAITHVLKRGSSGSQVTAVQRRLIKLGFLPATTNGVRNDDGDFGPKTYAAVKTFKKSKKYAGVLPNGEVGGGTVRLLGPTFTWKG